MTSLVESQSGRSRVVAGVAVAYLALAGAVLWLWLARTGVDTSPLIVAVCFAPAVLGAALAFTSTEDQTQYIARVLACVSFTPILLLFWGTSLDPDVAMPERAVWPFAVAAAIGHAAAFVGLIFWGGSFATLVPAAPNISPSQAQELRARLLALGRTGAPLDVSGEVGSVVVAALRLATGEERGHRVILNLHPARRVVRVQEKLTASGARPQDADEASMRGPGDDSFDPTRPTASRVSGKTAQTRMIDPQRLAAIPLRMFGEAVELPHDFASSLAPDDTVTLLCAVVTRSGWHWQPVFFGSGGG
ncbi:hypothetical protein [Ramlibacter sp. WS9]|uniref:hypothetical protein n=1 Tax=Ramlibacter sp. WS9 TaxID=1882741 RepID=UPI0011427D4C|nr:hypothetical protein [Ramlibacter sp. WS9]ROZ71578.1 hypothetical protein EEB15_21330 [Ramlibacter sp. WS9]